MARTGALREVWRRRVAMNEVMQRGSQIFPWLGPPGQILPQQQPPLHSSVSTSCSTTLSCHFQAYRRVRRHSSDAVRSIPSKQIEAGVESKNVFSNQIVRRSPDGGAQVPSNSHATHGKSGTRVEPAYIVLEQARISQNGAHPAVHNYSVPASRIVASVIRQTSAVANLHNPSLHRVQQEILTFRDQCRLQKMAARPYRREAQAPDRKHRREARALVGSQDARRRGDNVAQVEGASPQTCSEAAKCRRAARIIKQNRNTSREVVGEIQSLHQNTDRSKLELERVGDIKANSTRSRGANDALETREPELLSRDEGQSSAISEQGVTENSLRQDLFAKELLQKAHWMDDRSTPAWKKAGLNLTAKGRLQSRYSYGSRDWSRDSPQGNGSTHMHSARTTSEAIAVLQNRLQQGISTDSSAYIKVLQMSLQQKDLVAAKQVHDCIIESRMDQNPYVINTLLNVYVRCGGLLDARRVFDEFEKKTVITWTTMIAGYVKRDDAKSAVELFKLMLQEGARPDEVTYLSILKACRNPLALEWGKEIHECIQHAGFESDVRVGTAVLQMYAKCGSILEARRVFDKLTNRNSVTWNVMIGAYAASGNVDDARRMFDRMKKRDQITWNIMIGACAESGRGVEAYRLFLEMRREGFEPDPITYVSILNSSSSAGALDWVKEVHDHASKAGLESELRVGSALVRMYAKSGSLDDARLIFDRLKSLNVVTWNIMIGAYAERGLGKEAYRLFREMRREGLEPDAITYTSILNASASAGASEWVKDVHGHATTAGLLSDLRVGNAFVHMYAKCGSMDDAQLLFDRMKKRDVITWNIIIGAYAEHGRGVEAYRLFLEMTRGGFEPDAITYMSILNASVGTGTLEWVKEVHGHATKAGLDADLRVGNALVHMYAKCGSMDDARLMFDSMKKQDPITWNILIGAYAERGRGEEAHRLFLEMRRKGFEPDAVTYVSVLNASAGAGALDWVKEVHDYASKAGLDSDLRVGAALVHMYAKSGSIDDARLVFDRMEKHDVVTWTVMIGGLAQHGCGHEALELFRKMNSDLVKPNGTTFVAVLSACCHAGLLDDGRRIFLAMTQDFGIEPDIVHYTCMVDLLGRAGHLEEAKFLISDMRVEPDVVIWGALLGACRTHGNVELGELAANKLFKLVPNNASTYVLLSNIYAAAGEWDKVLLLRTMMQKRGLRKEPGRSWIAVHDKIHEFVAGDTSHPEAIAIYTYIDDLTEKLKAEGYIPDTQQVLKNIDEEDKELALCSHSEKLAIAYGLMRIPRGNPIRVHKNLRVCSDCHTATKFISKVTGREIIARDANRFHHFKDGVCSCGDYW